MRKTFVLGIDGGQISWIEKFRKKLPNFSYVLEKSKVKSSLNSSIPPLTIPAWLSIFTGKTPGEIGFADFISPTYNYDSKLNIYRGRFLWDITRSYVFIGVPGIKIKRINGIISDFNKIYKILKTSF